MALTMLDKQAENLSKAAWPPEIRADKGMAFKDIPTGPKNQ